MIDAPLYRVNGSSLEVIRNGRVIERVPLGDGEINVRVNGSAVEIAANGLIIERYQFDDRGSTGPSESEIGMTEIPIEGLGAADDANVMCY